MRADACDMCVQALVLCPGWAKAQVRLGVGLLGQRHWRDAIAAFQVGACMHGWVQDAGCGELAMPEDILSCQAGTAETVQAGSWAGEPGLLISNQPPNQSLSANACARG